MIHEASWTSVAIFAVFVALTLGISFWFAARTRSAKGYFAAHGSIHWFVNGIAFAGDYLSAASFLGICGMIAFYGYDGFLYSIGYLAGWIVALFVIAEPMKRLGKYTFADALDSTFQSRGIKLAVAVSTLAVSIFYLIPQMVGAGALIKPLLGWPREVGVLLVGTVVILIVTTAGMVSTTYVQFLKGSLLVIFSLILTVMILNRGLTTNPLPDDESVFRPRVLGPVPAADMDNYVAKEFGEDVEYLPKKAKPNKRKFVRVGRDNPAAPIWRIVKLSAQSGSDATPMIKLYSTQTVVELTRPKAMKLVNGLPFGVGEGKAALKSVGQIERLPNGETETGSLDPLGFLSTIKDSTILLWRKEVIKEGEGEDASTDKEEDKTKVTTIYYPQPTSGNDVLSPGNHPNFQGIRSGSFISKLNFLSLMLALFCGTASLPHILIRYFTVKDQASARKSTIVGIGSIGFFYVLTLFLGLGAMASGSMDVTNTNMAAPLLARSFGEWMFAIISAIAFTTVLGTVSGLIVASSGAVAHDLLAGFLKIDMTDTEKVRAGKITAIVVGVIAIVLGILFQNMNVSYLVGWAFSVAASANLPALVMLLFWKRTTKQGITAAVVVGMVSSLAWILLSGDTFEKVYEIGAEHALVPFSQPGIVTIPLGFLTLIVVSLLTPPKPASAAPQS